MITFANANLLLSDLCLQENFQMLWKVRPMYIPELFILSPLILCIFMKTKNSQNSKTKKQVEQKKRNNDLSGLL